MNGRLLALGALVATCLLSACSGDDGGEEEGPDVAGVIGDAGSACRLPVTFDRAMGWQPQVPDPIDQVSDAELREALAPLVSPGPFDLACEVESPRNIGFLRVYTGPAKLASRDHERVLRNFVEALEEGTDLTFTGRTAADGLAITDVAYTEVSALDDEEKPRRAFLVAVDDAVVVVHVGGLDAEEHEGMLPAYQLAMDSIRASS